MGRGGTCETLFHSNCGRGHLRLCNKIQLMQMFSEVVTRGLQKRDSNTSVFLLNLQKFWEHLFWRTSPNNCFRIFQMFNPFLVDDPILYPKGFLIFSGVSRGYKINTLDRDGLILIFKNLSSLLYCLLLCLKKSNVLK